MLNEDQIQKLLQPFGVELTPEQAARLQMYLELLMRWSAKINLTSIRAPEECVTRHFGESLLLRRTYDLKGTLLDIGSGAGFPALAMKLVFPELEVCLLEPVAKKRAFLKEVTRACEFSKVEVRPERIEDLSNDLTYDSLTMRAVGIVLIKSSLHHLKREGRAFFWLSKSQVSELDEVGLRFDHAIEIPDSRERVILPCSLKV